MSDYTLVFGNKNYSSWSLRPWIWMKQCGIPFTEKRVALFTDTVKKELEPYFSNGKVPVLVDGDFIVWDTLAILEYLADKHPDAPGWPVDQQARAVARSVSAEMHSSFSDLRGAMPMNCRKHFPGFEISDAAQRDIDRVISVWEYCRKHYGSGGDWLFGEFSIADAMYAPVVLRLHGYDVTLTGIADAYVQHVLANKHLQDWIEAGKQEVEIIELDEV
ncbi:MAG: glutathione S-transferase family protein [Proteobacteria bacterium]|nr:glutathione S-transferase family protein [Pseudomonadota bacterium]